MQSKSIPLLYTIDMADAQTPPLDSSTSTPNAASSPSCGLILFAHGSRDPVWTLPFEAILAGVRLAEPQLPARLAYLELMQPTFAHAVADLVAHGVQHIRVLPVFLAMGKHLRIDLPSFVAQAQALHTGLTITVLPPIGEAVALQRTVVALALQPFEPSDLGL